MDLIKLIIRNVFRHRLRSMLTIAGVCVAMLAFCMLQTLVSAWYVGVNASSADRLVTRNKTSLVHMLPVSYASRIRQVPGVDAVGYGIWYGGIYKERKNFFAQFAISGIEYLDLYPEFVLTEAERKTFDLNRNACIVGVKLAKRFDWKRGDIIPLTGTIFPGTIELVLAGIYRGARKDTDETVMLFRWDYLNEQLKQSLPEQADQAGWYIVRIKDPDRSAQIATEIDALFENSLAETLTETEKAFQLSFVAMTDAIVAAIQVISIVVVGIILIVLANTMAMTARERSTEYAVLKTLGFHPWFVFSLIAGESISIAFLGGVGGALLSIPTARYFQHELSAFIPVFQVSPKILVAMLGISILVGLCAAVPPAFRISRMPIARGLRHIG